MLTVNNKLNLKKTQCKKAQEKIFLTGSKNLKDHCIHEADVFETEQKHYEKLSSSIIFA